MIEKDVLEKIKAGARVKVAEQTGFFEGLVISRKHGSEPGGTFTVRTTLAGVSVEKVYPIHSPTIKKITVLSSPKKVHRSKLYFVRNVSDRKVKRRLKVAA